MSMSISAKILAEKINIQRETYTDDTVTETLTPGEQAIAKILQGMQDKIERLERLTIKEDCA